MMATTEDREVFVDDDSEGEFEGFEEEDVGEPLAARVQGMEWEPQEVDDDEDLAEDLPFTGNPGIQIHFEPTWTPLDIFNIFFTNTVWTMMVEETNRYAGQYLASHPNISDQSRAAAWKPVTLSEMRLFFALLMTMGLVVKSSMQRYWSTDRVIGTPFFSDIMPRNRFENILRFFHLADNDDPLRIPRGQPGFDPLFKVRTFLDAMNRTFHTTYQPEQDISIDEGICPWKGNLSFKVYNPAKPNKFGMKLYKLCESASSFCSHIHVYTGKQLQPGDDGDADQSVTFQLVMRLLHQCGLLYRGYKVFMDNYFTSPLLFDRLTEIDTMACGTARLTRKEMPKSLKLKKLVKDNVIFRCRGNLLALKWKDKRDVTILSNMHTSSMGVTGRKDRQGKFIIKPTAVLDYSKKMGGVDTGDQLLQYFETLRKTVKWWKKLFFNVHAIVTTNAFILWKQHGQANLSHHDFLLTVIKELVQSANGAPLPQPRGRRPQSQVPSRLVERHFASSIKSKPGAKKQKICRECVVHKTIKIRKETRYECASCQVALCLEPCFKRFHTLKYFSLPLHPHIHEQ